MQKHIRLFSFGGGVQSHAVLALQAQNRLDVPYDVFVFSNVGHDSENPDTLNYLNKVTIPFCEEFGIELVEVRKTTRGKPETLYEYIHRVKKSVPIPAYMSNGAPGNRSCTIDFKIRVVNKWVRDQGYTHAIMGLGLSIDEYQRVRDEKWHEEDGIQKQRHHPLIELGLSRTDCHKIIADMSLPQPPKSSCWFCPFTQRNEWIELKSKRPDLFEKAVALEKHINEKRDAMGRDYIYLYRQTRGEMVKLEDAVGDQLSLFDLMDEDDTCESGYCFI